MIQRFELQTSTSAWPRRPLNVRVPPPKASRPLNDEVKAVARALRHKLAYEERMREIHRPRRLPPSVINKESPWDGSHPSEAP